MRCDSCPLCPTAEDDVCPESEGKYGMEHADGKLGCKHPWNWAKKRDEEHTEYLGNMGTDMGIEMSFSKTDLERVVNICKHMIGLDYNQPYHRHKKAFYKPYRNYFSAEFGGHKLLDRLPCGCLDKWKGERYLYYSLTRVGLDWLGRRLNITIWNEED